MSKILLERTTPKAKVLEVAQRLATGQAQHNVGIAIGLQRFRAAHLVGQCSAQRVRLVATAHPKVGIRCLPVVVEIGDLQCPIVQCVDLARNAVRSRRNVTQKGLTQPTGCLMQNQC